MRLSREEVAARLPHAGRMVLIDEVSEWDDERIVCRTATHLDRANPLYVAGHLSSVCAIEFAAQAMAVHGTLLVQRASTAPDDSPVKPRAGFLASVRNVVMAVDRLDDIVGVLTIEATRESGDDLRVLYRFDVKSGAKSLVSGRAAVVLQMPDRTEARSA